MDPIPDFEYNVSPARVVFSRGSLLKLPAELTRQHLIRPLLLSTPRQIHHVEALNTNLDGRAAGIFTEAVMHTPTEVTEKALAYAKSVDADAVVSIGGGSTVGLGKAISVRTGLPHICIPTTYAGSEMTPILGETTDGLKTTRSDPKILPGTVIYDVDLTLTLPVGLSATSGVNAIAHAVEALYARNANPITSLLALESIRALFTALPLILSTSFAHSPSILSTLMAARTTAQYGAYLAGACLGSTTMSLHHKLCHTLGGTFNLPHAETHTIVLPHALAYNAPAIPAHVLARLAAAFPVSDEGGDIMTGDGVSKFDAVRSLNHLLKALKVKRSLRELGMNEADIDRAADLATQNPYWNPRKVEREGVREVIRRAWAGEEARVDL